MATDLGQQGARSTGCAGNDFPPVPSAERSSASFPFVGKARRRVDQGEPGVGRGTHKLLRIESPVRIYIELVVGRQALAAGRRRRQGEPVGTAAACDDWSPVHLRICRWPGGARRRTGGNKIRRFQRRVSPFPFLRKGRL